MRRTTLLVLIPMLWALLSASPSAAQTRLFVPCPSGPPCSIAIPGHIDAIGAARLPWVASFAVPAGVCFDLYNISADGPILRSVIAPNGVVFRSNGFIAIRPTMAGWYTVQFDSEPPGLEQIFLINFSLDAVGSCTIPTPGR